MFFSFKNEEQVKIRPNILESCFFCVNLGGKEMTDMVCGHLYTTVGPIKLTSVVDGQKMRFQTP